MIAPTTVNRRSEAVVVCTMSGIKFCVLLFYMRFWFIYKYFGSVIQNFLDLSFLELVTLCVHRSVFVFLISVLSFWLVVCVCWSVRLVMDLNGRKWVKNLFDQLRLLRTQLAFQLSRRCTHNTPSIKKVLGLIC